MWFDCVVAVDDDDGEGRICALHNIHKSSYYLFSDMSLVSWAIFWIKKLHQEVRWLFFGIWEKNNMLLCFFVVPLPAHIKFTCEIVKKMHAYCVCLLT